jgi:NAD(P)-dependent dehydrogenase (short-subunit alcohol dehydrogenase family)
MNPPFTLHGETALITGGGSGLGLGMARCLTAAGARVVLMGRTEPALQAAVAELGERAACVVHDVTDLDRTAQAFDAACAQAGAPVSILINNAGNHIKKAAVDTTPAELELMLQTHVVAAHTLTRAALPGMLERRHGSILFTASMAALFGIPYVSAYSAAKAALVGLTRALAGEVGAHGVRVNAIAPGWIESPMLRKSLDGDDQRRRKILDRTPLQRFGDPEDIGWAAVYLCSPAGRFVTGAVLPVDGGASVGF